MELFCPFSPYDAGHWVKVPFDEPFSHLGEWFPCPTCGKNVSVNYESIYDEEAQDSQGWFYLEGEE